MDMRLPTFDIYKSIVAPIFLRTTNSWWPDLFEKKNSLMSDLKSTLSDVTSLLSDNLSGRLKKLYSGLDLSLFFDLLTSGIDDVIYSGLLNAHFSLLKTRLVILAMYATFSFRWSQIFDLRSLNKKNAHIYRMNFFLAKLKKVLAEVKAKEAYIG